MSYDSNFIEQAWEDRTLLRQAQVQAAIEAAIDNLDRGQQRVAMPTSEGWKVNETLKKAVMLYFQKSNKISEKLHLQSLMIFSERSSLHDIAARVSIFLLG